MSDGSLAPDELRATALRGFRWTVIARPSVEIVLLGSLIVLSRLVTPAEFGRFAVASLVGALGMIPATGVGTALVQRPNASREDVQTAFALSLISAVALCGLTVLLAGFVMTPIFGARTALLTRLSAPGALIVGMTTVSNALLQRNLEFRRLALLDMSGTITRAVASIVLAAIGLQAVGLVLGGLIGALVASVLNWIWAPAPFPRLFRQPARELTAYGLPASASAVSWIGFQNIDYAIVGATLGATASGFYFRAYTLGVEYQRKVSQVMNTVGFPVLSRTQSAEEMAELRHKMVRLLTILLFPALAVLSIVAPVLIPWMFGAEWTPAVVPTQILAIGGASVLAIDGAGAVLMASGRARAMVAFGWGHFLCYGAAVYVVASHGIVAVAVAAAIVHTVFLFIAYALMLRGSGQNPFARLWDDLSPATVCSLSAVAVALPASWGLRAVGAPAFPYLVAVTLVGFGAYAVILRLAFRDSFRMMGSFISHLLPTWRPRRRQAAPPAPHDAAPAPVAGAGLSRPQPASRTAP